MTDRPSTKHTMTRDAEAREFGRRLDEILTRKGWSITDLQRATDVTFATASRWRKGEVLPGSPQQWGILFKVLHVTPWELMPTLEDYEPPHAAWRAFLATPEGKSMTAAERQALAWSPVAGTPTVGTYQLLLAAQKTATP